MPGAVTVGMDVTVTHFIWAITLIGASVLAVGTVTNAQDDVTDGLQERRVIEREHIGTILGTARVAYDFPSRTLTITVENRGDVPLDAAGVTLVLDGHPVTSGFSYAVTGASGSDVWLPGEDLVFTLTNRSGAPARIHVLTAAGVSGMTTIPAGPVTNVIVLPDPVDVEAGGTQDFEAYAYDANWHRAMDVSFTWTTNAGTIASLTEDTARLTAQTTAEDGLSVTATESGSGAAGSATVNVVPGPLESIRVSPSSVTLAPSTSKQFTATGEDAYGNPVTLDAVTWSTTVGSITQDGLLTAPASSATGTVTASQDGVSGTASVLVRRYSYASEGFTDYAGGTVTNAVAWTQATGDVATLTEATQNGVRTYPAAQNDRDFEADPVDGWALTPVSRTWTLSRDAADGTPTTTGALRAEQSDNGNGEAHVEYSWTQSTQANPTDATFTMDYKGTETAHTNRYLEAWLVKPDGSTVQIGARKDSTAGAWTAFGATTVPASEITSAGTYTLRLVVAMRGASEAWLVDNVQLTWDDTNYRFGKTLTVPDIPEGDGATHTLEVRYRATTGEALQLWVEGPTGSWTQRATLPSLTMTTASVTLNADDVNANTVTLRLIDAAQTADGTQDAWDVDFVRVESTG